MIEKGLKWMIIGFGFVVCCAQSYRYGQHHPGVEYVQIQEAYTDARGAYKQGFDACQEQF